jgi:hypothetical protein
MLKIEFERPSHGWMPVKITYKDIEESFGVSDVPIDPITQLENVLDSAITGGGGEVWLHLEPGGYYLSLFAEDNEFNVNLEFSINSMKETRELVFEYTGSFEETVVPIWRSLRKLQSYNWSEFSVSKDKMESITKQVKSWPKG